MQGKLRVFVEGAVEGLAISTQGHRVAVLAVDHDDLIALHLVFRLLVLGDHQLKSICRHDELFRIFLWRFVLFS